MKPGDVICVRYDGYQPFHFGVCVGEEHVVHMVVPNIFPCFMSCGSGNEQTMKSCGISSGCLSKQGTFLARYGIFSDCSSKQESIPARYGISSDCSSKQESIPARCEIFSGFSSKKEKIPAGFGRVQKNTIQSFHKGRKITVVRSWVFKPLPVEEILRRCEERVGKLIKFDPVNYNCEHFAYEMRYGQPMSHQVQATCAVGGAVLGGFAFVGGLTVAPILGAVAVGSASSYYIGSAISSKWSKWWRKRNKENVKQE